MSVYIIILHSSVSVEESIGSSSRTFKSTIVISIIKLSFIVCLKQESCTKACNTQIEIKLTYRNFVQRIQKKCLNQHVNVVSNRAFVSQRPRTNKNIILHCFYDEGELVGCNLSPQQWRHACVNWAGINFCRLFCCIRQFICILKIFYLGSD